MADLSTQAPAADTTPGFFGVTLVTISGEYELPASLIKELYFIEDINTPYVTGKLTFVDGLGLLESGPIIGSEQIIIQYSSSRESEKKVVKSFQSFKLSDISSMSQTDPSTTVIELHFVDTYFLLLCTPVYSRSWPKETPGHEIVKHIITKMSGIDEKYIDKDNWEECREKVDYFYMPWWTCNTAIKYLMRKMSGAKSELGGYLFYANTKGSIDRPEDEQLFTLNFVTLDTLLANTNMIQIGKDDDSVYSVTDIKGGESENPGPSISGKQDYNRILSYVIDSVDLSNVKTLQGGHYFGYDTQKKTFLDADYTYTKELAKHTVLGETSLFLDISDSTAAQIFTGEDRQEYVDNMKYNDWAKKYCMQNYLNIVVQGHELRYAGGLIKVSWPSRNLDKPANMLMSGGYLVKSITHYFNPVDTISYRQKMVLIKNGYDEEALGTTIATKKNTLLKYVIGK